MNANRACRIWTVMKPGGRAIRCAREAAMICSLAVESVEGEMHRSVQGR